LIRFAKCCNPLPGDSITGFVTRGRGITIHEADCLKIFESDPARRVEVAWDAGSSASRPGKIKVVCVDKPGLLADISKAITAMDVDIRRAMVVTTKDERAVCDFEIAVKDVHHLTRVIKSITRINNVISVVRVKH
jgi:GTP pyrophosphokinase